MEELAIYRTCCGCETSSSYWFGLTCGNCGHWLKDCEHNEDKEMKEEYKPKKITPEQLEKVKTILNNLDPALNCECGYQH
jgi:hypothetical protein